MQDIQIGCIIIDSDNRRCWSVDFDFFFFLFLLLFAVVFWLFKYSSSSCRNFGRNIDKTFRAIIRKPEYGIGFLLASVSPNITYCIKEKMRESLIYFLYYSSMINVWPSQQIVCFPIRTIKKTFDWWQCRVLCFVWQSGLAIRPRFWWGVTATDRCQRFFLSLKVWRQVKKNGGFIKKKKLHEQILRRKKKRSVLNVHRLKCCRILPWRSTTVEIKPTALYRI